MGTKLKLCRDELSKEHRDPSLVEHRNKREVKKTGRAHHLPEY
jgi:hypothetical protein